MTDLMKALEDSLATARAEDRRRRHKDPVTGRCYKCGRFVPDEGLGSVVYDDYTGGYEYVEGECPAGFGCHKKPELVGKHEER